MSDMDDDEYIDCLKEQVAWLLSENEKLREALYPFVFGDPTLREILYRDMPDEQTGTITISLGHLRAAAAAIRETGE